MGVRYATEEDIDEVLEIERASFPEPWDHHAFKGAFNDIFLVHDEEHVGGFLVCVCCYRNIRATIMKIAVHPRDRRKGIATEMLNCLLEMLKKRGIQEVDLNVDMIIEPAIALYKKFGFQITKTIRLSYEEEALDDGFYVMALKLNHN